MSHVVDGQTLYASMWNGQDDRLSTLEATAAGGGPAYVVASAGATDEEKDLADAVCDGVNDHVEIQAGHDDRGYVHLVGDDFSNTQPVNYDPGAVFTGDSRLKSVITYSGSGYAFKAASPTADNRAPRFENFGVTKGGSATGAFDMRGVWRFEIHGCKATNFSEGIRGGGDTQI
jgi:hypothetical protein